MKRMLLVLLMLLTAPLSAQVTVRPAPEDTAYVDDTSIRTTREGLESLGRVFQQALDENRSVFGCLYGQRLAVSDGTFVAALDSAVVEPYCGPASTGVIGVFGTWHAKESPVDHPVALNWLDLQLDKRPSWCLVMIVYELVAVPDKRSGELIKTAKTYYTVRLRG